MSISVIDLLAVNILRLVFTASVNYRSVDSMRAIGVTIENASWAYSEIPMTVINAFHWPQSFSTGRTSERF